MTDKWRIDMARDRKLRKKYLLDRIKIRNSCVHTINEARRAILHENSKDFQEAKMLDSNIEKIV